MEKTSSFTLLIFTVATFFTLWQFYLATKRSKTALVVVMVWAAVQSLVSLTGFYSVTNTLPPRFVLLIGPALLIPLLFLVTKRGKQFIDGLDLKHLTLLHATRIPVEVALHAIFTAGLIPQIMTYEGYNFDILSGITAIIVFYLVFTKRTLASKFLLAWNIFGLLLLFNILIIAVLSAKTPFQKLAFEQPNVGVTLFPFVLLPAIIVPLVFFAHLAAIRQLVSCANLLNPDLKPAQFQSL